MQVIVSRRRRQWCAPEYLQEAAQLCTGTSRASLVRVVNGRRYVDPHRATERLVRKLLVKCSPSGCARSGHMVLS